ncbi:hypothetical protein Syn19_056 [Synechococcus phage Syn19]|uniref:Uncharacterized protein n=2 Tax=Pontusvirus syn19 TaxID=2734134 RepID=M4SJG1_9CAUD|nr:hypothetical protein Syn19_056 [Synechococcus phage Syn19]ADO99501.1 hypothetical protein Syn19_056 [Synechococcus phage Syn19]AGH56467.1 hypothetical protein CPTG_00176 [Cyanophage Syn2]
MASRVKLVAKSRKANKILTYDMKRDPYAYVTDRKDKWNIFHPNSGMQFWIHPKNDPDWEIKS